MTLPSSGTISANDIRVELGVPSQAPFSYGEAAQGAYATINIWSSSKPQAYGPFLLSSWYSYDHNAPSPNLFTFSVIGTTDPIYGGFLASWSENGGLAIASYNLWYSFDYGASWSSFSTYGQYVYDSGYQSVEGFVGFTSLDNTYFRLTATTYGIEVPGSPKFAYPPFPY